MPSNGPREPIIEAPTHEPGREEPGDRAARLRVRQQEILAELGVTALKGTPFDDLLKEAVVLSAQGLEAELCKVLEYIPAQNRLLMRAGVGWDEGLVGTASVGADLASPSGYALRTGKPVISNHLESEQRFRTPDLLAAHGVRRAINVILQGDGAPYGVLEVDSRSAGEFSERDIAFLQGAANILGDGDRTAAPRAGAQSGARAPAGASAGDQPSGEEQLAAGRGDAPAAGGR